jgi:cysteinyl-tRNA synthetase
MSLDIIRRVIEDYFHYQVSYYTNLTDMDDKVYLLLLNFYILYIHFFLFQDY